MKKLLCILLAFTTVCFGAPVLVSNDLDFSRAAILNIASITGRATSPITIEGGANDQGININTLDDAPIYLNTGAGSDINLMSGQNIYLNAAINNNVDLQASGTGTVQAQTPVFQVITPGGISGNLSTTANSFNITTGGGTNNDLNLNPGGTGSINMFDQVAMVNGSSITAGTLSVDSSNFNIYGQNNANLNIGAIGTGTLLAEGASVLVRSTATNSNVVMQATGTGHVSIFGPLVMGDVTGTGSSTIEGTASNTLTMFANTVRFNGLSVASATNTLLGNVSGSDLILQAPSGNRNIVLNPTGTGVVTVNGSISTTKLLIPAGANASANTTAAMSGSPGAVTVTNSSVTASSIIIFSRKTTGGTPGQVSITAQSSGSFTLTSTSAETSTFNYEVIN